MCSEGVVYPCSVVFPECFVKVNECFALVCFVLF